MIGTKIGTHSIVKFSLKDIVFLPHGREHVDVVHNVLGTRIGPISISGILPLFMKSCVPLQGELNAL